MFAPICIKFSPKIALHAHFLKMQGLIKALIYLSYVDIKIDF